jgi:predicted nucleic acid-binding protein
MISGFEANTVWSAFQRDCEDGVWIPAAFPERAWETADDLARRHGAILGIRTLDSLHIACALELNASCFWTFDRRQARLAEAIGLPLQP